MAKSKSLYKKKHHQKKKNSKKTHGGNTSAWATQVVGPYPHSIQPGTSNLIQQQVPAINTMSGGSFLLSPADVTPEVNNNVPPAPGSVPVIVKTPTVVSGGKKKRSNKRKGGNVLSELAVPAVLLIANQTIGRKTGKKMHHGRKRFSRRYRK